MSALGVLQHKESSTHTKNILPLIIKNSVQMSGNFIVLSRLWILESRGSVCVCVIAGWDLQETFSQTVTQSFLSHVEVAQSHHGLDIHVLSSWVLSVSLSWLDVECLYSWVNCIIFSRGQKYSLHHTVLSHHIRKKALSLYLSLLVYFLVPFFQISNQRTFC